MTNKLERQEDILKIISQLDISPTMYKNADEKYHAIAKFLEDCGIDADMYPQGSFAFGTVVRPTNKETDPSYDLDFICQIKATRDSISPSSLRKKIQQALESSEAYAKKLTVYNECFTIEYADINGIGFTIDIVPATDENSETKKRLQNESGRPDLITTAIAIPRHNGERNYNWLTNNPKGFKTWFDEINAPYLAYNRDSRRQRIFENNRHIFASVEDIPDAVDRSAMQRVIQLLKYHRDSYYSHIKDGADLKPISAIINTLVAYISKTYDPHASVFELLEYVLNELSIYAEHQTKSPTTFAQIYGDRSVITHTDCKWKIANPANPEDNLADSWNQNSKIPEAFFNWIVVCKEDLLNALDLPDDRFRTSAENTFGVKNVRDSWGSKYHPVTPKPIITTSAAKPYQASL